MNLTPRLRYSLPAPFTACCAAALLLLDPQTARTADNTQNLVINGDMEVAGGWEPANVGGPTKPELVEISGDDKHEGNNSLHIVLERRQPDEYPQVTTGLFPTEDGRYYKISFWYKVLQGVFSANMRTGADNDYVQITKKPLTETDGWELFEGEYQEKAGGPSARFTITGATDGVCEMYLDDVLVQPLE